MIVAMQNQLESFLRLAYNEDKKALICDRGILDTGSPLDRKEEAVPLMLPDGTKRLS